MPIVVIAMEQPDYDAWVKKTLEQQKQKTGFERPDP